MRALPAVCTGLLFRDMPFPAFMELSANLFVPDYGLRYREEDKAGLLAHASLPSANLVCPPTSAFHTHNHQ